MQEKVKRFVEENKLQMSPEHAALDLISELGEVAKEILKATDYGRHPPKKREEIKSELGDALYSLINLANTLNVDIEEALELAMEKYKKRIQKGSTPDSRNE
ncbi:MAG: MazG nucleotide pyrophosphohydrolase domain-containing protein [Candidatus Aenigmatarchaeota archaeon]